MKTSEFNDLLTHVENELCCFKRYYKLYDDIYIFRNFDRTKCIEFRFICSNVISIRKYNLLKDDSSKIIDEILTNESSYKFSTIQSLKMLKFLESTC